ncbi:MAG: hypothetical protein FJ009_21305 [Chloroflexi bacterium]|nr:hypothetical protein [Chloroflexota bacterium]
MSSPFSTLGASVGFGAAVGGTAVGLGASVGLGAAGAAVGGAAVTAGAGAGAHAATITSATSASKTSNLERICSSPFRNSFWYFWNRKIESSSQHHPFRLWYYLGCENCDKDAALEQTVPISFYHKSSDLANRRRRPFEQLRARDSSVFVSSTQRQKNGM